MFKVGEKVVCIERPDPDNVETVYEITSVFVGFDLWAASSCLKVTLKGEEIHSFYANRFINAEKYFHDKSFQNKLEGICE